MTEPLHPRTTFKIERPIPHPAGPIFEIKLRDPTYADYREIGEVFTLTFDERGRGIPVEVESVVFAYVEKCLVEPRDPLLLSLLSIADARKLRGWVLGFFTPDVAASEDSTTSSQTSSSGLDASRSATP